jgi:hypothetical protein
MAGRGDQTDKPCVHVSPEVWRGQDKRWSQALSDGEIDGVYDDGQVGEISWYIPYTTARRFPAFTSYQGLVGQRQLLAQIFRRPTTWREYCYEVSLNLCAVCRMESPVGCQRKTKRISFLAATILLDIFEPQKRMTVK